MILIDLQKTFDIINYEILLKEMSSFQYSNHSIKWFKSYLFFNRSIQINIKNKHSRIAKIDCGVPQGLGPLLFHLYVNHINQAVECDLFLCADDLLLLKR